MPRPTTTIGDAASLSRVDAVDDGISDRNGLPYADEGLGEIGESAVDQTSPSANGVDAQTDVSSAVAEAVLIFDTELEHDLLPIAQFGQASNRTVIDSGDDVLANAHKNNFAGKDSLMHTIMEGELTSLTTGSVDVTEPQGPSVISGTKEIDLGSLNLIVSDVLADTVRDEFGTNLDFGNGDLIQLSGFLGTLSEDNFVGVVPPPAFNVITGTDENDNLRGTEQADEIIGLDGVDFLFGFGGNDVLRGGEGFDYLSGGEGDDTLIGGGTEDPFNGDFFLLGPGNDTLIGDDDTLDVIIAGDETNFITAPIEIDLSLGVVSKDGFGGTDSLTSIESVSLVGTGDDSVIGTDGPNQFLILGGGADIIEGKDGNDNFLIDTAVLSIDGGLGFDSLGLSSIIRIFGEEGEAPQVIDRPSGIHVDLSQSLLIDDGFGGQTQLTGIEQVSGTNFADILIGDAQDNRFAGSGGDDFIDAGAGDDLLVVNEGNNILLGGSGDDTLWVVFGDGNNTLEGGEGDDGLILAGGVTTVSLSPGDGNDIIARGFDVEFDLIDVSGFSLTSAQALALAQQVGTATALDFGNGDSLTIQDFLASDLTEANFIGVAPPPPPENDFNVIEAGVGKENLVGTDEADAFTFARGTSVNGAIDTVRDWTPGDIIDLSALSLSEGDVQVRTISNGTVVKLIEGFGAGEFHVKINLNGFSQQELLDVVIYDAMSPPPPPPPENVGPTANDDDAETLENAAVTVSVLINDTDPEGDALSIAQFGQGLNGTVTDLGNGVLEYSPNNNFVGEDSFTYTITDGELTSQATVSVDVTATPPPPAPEDEFNVIEAGIGKENLVGSDQADAFTFAPGTSVNGAIDTVRDWAPGDVIDLSALGLNATDYEIRTVSSGSVVKLIEGFSAGEFHVKINLNGFSQDEVLGSIIYDEGTPPPPLVNTIIGTDDDDVLEGTSANDRILAEDGMDELFGFEGDDILEGGPGRDLLYGGVGSDLLIGGEGINDFFPGLGNDTIDGSEGRARVFYSDLPIGDMSIDLEAGIASYSDLSGNAYRDVFIEVNSVTGGPQNDTIRAGSLGGEVFGGPGNDTLFGSASQDLIFGSDGADVIFGGDGEDSLIGDAGDDIIFGGGGNDFVILGEGADIFVMAPGGGADGIAVTNVSNEIVDRFSISEDRIDVTAFGITATQALALVSQNNESAIIDFGNGDRISLATINPSDLSEANFIGVLPPPPQEDFNVIEAGIGKENLVGTSAADAFVFTGGTSVNGAIDTVRDWAPGDIIDLSALGLTEAEVEVRTISGGSVVKLIEGFGAGEFHVKINLNNFSQEELLDSVVYAPSAALLPLAETTIASSGPIQIGASSKALFDPHEPLEEYDAYDGDGKDGGVVMTPVKEHFVSAGSVTSLVQTLFEPSASTQPTVLTDWFSGTLSQGMIGGSTDIIPATTNLDFSDVTTSEDIKINASDWDFA